MKLQVFTVFDSAVGAYLQPFFCRSRGEALRSFSDACNDEKQNFNRHPLDYTLVYLGEFDDAGGAFTSVIPERVVSALDCKADDMFTEDKRLGGNGKEKGLPM